MAPWFLALLRVVTALLFMSHGTMKLLGFPASDMSPPLLSLFGIAGVIEIVGGILLVLGLFTRPAAFVLSGEMAVAYFVAHAPQGFFPLQNGGESAVLFCFIFLYLVFAGPGAAAVDNIRSGAAAPAAQRAG
ncbi:MAG TPA: DoxX family protein [Bauldia sp.]|nr:DoxX family protein [Bauldia sp.]